MSQPPKVKSLPTRCNMPPNPAQMVNFFQGIGGGEGCGANVKNPGSAPFVLICPSSNLWGSVLMHAHQAEPPACTGGRRPTHPPAIPSVLGLAASHALGSLGGFTYPFRVGVQHVVKWNLTTCCESGRVVAEPIQTRSDETNGVRDEHDLPGHLRCRDWFWH